MMPKTRTRLLPSAAPDASVRLSTGLLMVLTFATGVVDAVSFLSPERVFAGNMTGNVVIIGVAVSHLHPPSAVAPGLALVLFALGAAVAGRTLRKAPPGWSSRCTAMIAGVGAVLGVVSAVQFTTSRSTLQGLIVAGALSLAMGVQAAAARHLSVKDLTTVVVTSTMTGLAADSWLGAHRPQPALRRAAAILLLAAGAGAGAGLIRWGPGWATVTAAVPVLAAAVVGQVATARAAKG